MKAFNIGFVNSHARQSLVIAAGLQAQIIVS